MAVAAVVVAWGTTAAWGVAVAAGVVGVVAAVTEETAEEEAALVAGCFAFAVDVFSRVDMVLFLLAGVAFEFCFVDVTWSCAKPSSCRGVTTLAQSHTRVER